MSDNPFVGSWTYRSFLNDPDVSKDFDKLEFGRGTITIEVAGESVILDAGDAVTVVYRLRESEKTRRRTRQGRRLSGVNSHQRYDPTASAIALAIAVWPSSFGCI